MEFTFTVTTTVDIPDSVIDDLVKDARDWGDTHLLLTDFLEHDMGYADCAEADALYDKLKEEIERRLKDN